MTTQAPLPGNQNTAIAVDPPPRPRFWDAAALAVIVAGVLAASGAIFTAQVEFEKQRVMDAAQTQRELELQRQTSDLERCRVAATFFGDEQLNAAADAELVAIMKEAARACRSEAPNE